MLDQFEEEDIAAKKKNKSNQHTKYLLLLEYWRRDGGYDINIKNI